MRLPLANRCELNKNTIALFLTICFFCNAQSQRLYLKTYARYHLSISAEPAPQYFYPGYLANGYGIGYNVSSDIESFSIATGFKYGGAAGYQFNNVLGIETSIDYFGTNRNIKADFAPFAYAATTRWNYHSIDATPSLIAKKAMNKSSLSIKVGPIIGMAWLKNTVDAGDYLSTTYLLEKHLIFGYSMGIEYDCKISSSISLFVESGLEHSSYTPSKARLEAIKLPGSTSVQEQSEYRKKIEYVKQVRNLDAFPNYNYSNSYVSDQTRPEIRIKQSMVFNTAYLGIGVKYNLGGNEKK
jgi:hypothetical protein